MSSQIDCTGASLYAQKSVFVVLSNEYVLFHFAEECILC